MQKKFDWVLNNGPVVVTYTSTNATGIFKKIFFDTDTWLKWIDKTKDTVTIHETQALKDQEK